MTREQFIVEIESYGWKRVKYRGRGLQQWSRGFSSSRNLLVCGACYVNRGRVGLKIPYRFWTSEMVASIFGKGV